MSDEERSEIERIFPRIAEEGYEVTSPADPRYNCIAWTAADHRRFWWPDPLNQAYWPPGVPRACTIPAFQAAFALLGYVPCEDGAIEIGFEKIAFYVDESGNPTHGARQTPHGTWLSKLGRAPDIEHRTLDAVAGEQYGKPALFMKRPVPLSSA